MRQLRCPIAALRRKTIRSELPVRDGQQCFRTAAVAPAGNQNISNMKTMAEMIQRRVRGSPWESRRVPSGTPTSAQAPMVRSRADSPGGRYHTERQDAIFHQENCRSDKRPDNGSGKRNEDDSYAEARKPRARPARKAATPANMASSDDGLCTVMNDEMRRNRDWTCG